MLAGITLDTGGLRSLSRSEPDHCTASDCRCSSEPSPAPTAASFGQASVSPAAAARPVVNIVEPPYRPPQDWTYVAAEFIAADTGLGYLINYSRTWFQVDNTMLGAIIIGTLGLTSSYLLVALERRLFRWRATAR